MPSIKKNYAYSMVYQIMQMVIPLITAPYVARVIGVNGVGAFSYTRSIAYYFLLFGMLGVNNYGSRAIAQVRSDRLKTNRVFSELFGIQIVISLIFFLLFVLCFIVLNNTDRLIYVAQTPYVLSAAFDINWFFFGIEEFKITVVRKVAIKIITTISIFVFIKNEEQVVLYTWIMNIGYFLGQCYLLLCFKRYVSLQKFEFLEAFKEHLKPLMILFVPVLATSVYRVMDKVMIGYFVNISDVGLYENADRIICVCVGVVSAWGCVMLPRISNLYTKGDKKTCDNYLRKSIEFINFITIAMAFGLVSIAKDFVVLYYGPNFARSSVILSGLAITIVLIGWSNTVRNQVLIPSEKDTIYAKAVVFGAIINLLVNFLLIPKYGCLGAVAGTVIAEAFVATYQAVPVKRQLNFKIYLYDSLPYLFFALIMCVCVCAIGSLFDNLFLKILLQIVVGVFIYIIFSFVFFYFKKDSFCHPYICRMFKTLRQ